MNDIASFSILTSQLSSDFLKKIGPQNKLHVTLNNLIEKVKNGTFGNWIWDPNCQILALEACGLNKIAIAEFCSLTSVRSLIEDHDELKLDYAKIETLNAFTLPVLLSECNYLKKSLRIGEEPLITERAFEKALVQSRSFSNFEKLVFTVELNSYDTWPTMLQILYQHGKLFRPINISGKIILLIPSYSLRKSLVSAVYGEEYACDPVPIIGSIPVEILLKYEKRGGRVIGYNFPGLENMVDADLIFTGKMFYTEHDWSHVDENSLLSKSNQKLLAEINELYFSNYCNFKNNGYAEYRIFSLGDMEFQCHNLAWKTGIKNDNQSDLDEAHKNQLILLLIFIEVFFLPMACQFNTYEMLSLEKAILGDNLKDEGIVRIVPIEKLQIFQAQWNADMDVFIKKLLVYFLINRNTIIDQYKFDIESFDWKLQRSESQYYLDMCVNEILGFGKFSINSIKRKLEKLGKYYHSCEEHLSSLLYIDNQLSIASADAITTIIERWRDPMPDFTFNTHHISSIEFYIGKGLKVKADEISS